MSEEFRAFEIEFLPEGKNFKEEHIVKAEDGLKAIEKIRESEGQQTLILSITEVHPPEEKKGMAGGFIDTSQTYVSYDLLMEYLRGKVANLETAKVLGQYFDIDPAYYDGAIQSITKMMIDLEDGLIFKQETDGEQ